MRVAEIVSRPGTFDAACNCALSGLPVVLETKLAGRPRLCGAAWRYARISNSPGGLFFSTNVFPRCCIANRMQQQLFKDGRAVLTRKVSTRCSAAAVSSRVALFRCKAGQQPLPQRVLLGSAVTLNVFDCGLMNTLVQRFTPFATLFVYRCRVHPVCSCHELALHQLGLAVMRLRF